LPSDLEVAYLAGLIDGEGCLRIEKSGGKYRYTPHTPTVCITNCNPSLILWVYRKFGGHLYQKKNRGTFQVTWDIYWLGRKATELLEDVYPYLTAKKEQAELMLSYRELIGKPGKKLSEDNISKRWAIIEAMKTLKRNNQVLVKEVD